MSSATPGPEVLRLERTPASPEPAYLAGAGDETQAA
jgi:hypothetical protein